MFPSGAIIKYKNESSDGAKQIFDTQKLVRGWMKDRSIQTSIPSFLKKFGSNWSLKILSITGITRFAPL